MFTSKIGTLFNQATSNARNPAAWLLQSLGLANQSASGISVNINSVLSIPEVWMAVSKISGHLAQMPVECRKFEEDERGIEYSTRVGTDAGARVLSSPSEFFTKATLIEKWVVDALLYGNGRLYIERGSNGQIKALYPLNAETCQTIVANGERWHTVTVDSGSEVGNLKVGDKRAGTMYKHRQQLAALQQAAAAG